MGVLKYQPFFYEFKKQNSNFDFQFSISKTTEIESKYRVLIFNLQEKRK